MSIRRTLTILNFYMIYAIEYLPLRIHYAFFDPNIVQKGKEETRLMVTTIGDSITAGMCSSSFTLASKENYAAYLSKMLGFDLINLSYPFAISKDALKQAQRAPESDVMVVFIGANDAILGREVSKYGNDLKRIIEIAKGKARVVIILGLPNFSCVKDTDSMRCKITRTVLFPLGLIVSDPDVVMRFERFNSKIKEIAKEQGVRFVDMSKIEFSDEELGSDCFHPSPLGQRRIAEEVYTAIKQFPESLFKGRLP